MSLAADQLTKAWALAHLTDGQPRPIIGTFLQFYLTFNPGAAFSTGTKFTWVFTSLAIIATFVVIRYAATARSRAWAVSLGLLLGGITGNLTDRLTPATGVLQGPCRRLLDVAAIGRCSTSQTC
ncbi:MAG: signal peptidase II [Marmoricola sp.]